MSSLWNFLVLLSLVMASNAALSSDYESLIRFHWKGDLHSHSITLKVFPYVDKLLESRANGFVVLYTKAENDTLANIRNFSISFVNEEYPVSEIIIDSLVPETKYFYTFVFTQETPILETDFLDYYASNHPQEFSFETQNIALKPYSFTFGAASCATTGSKSPVFNNLTDENFNFFIHMGDLHYSDINKDDIKLFYEAYYTVFGSETQKKFFQSTPIVYNWDDHDFGVNDAMGTSPSKPAVTAAYKKFVPHNPLKNYLPSDDTIAFPDQAPRASIDSKGYLDYDSDSQFGIYRSFIVGRCLFIVLDLRSFQHLIPGDIMGQEQKTWVENQLRFAGNNPDIKMVFMISSVPWIDADRGALWEDFPTDQQWLGDLIDQHVHKKDKKMMMLAGDAHMVALDDGSNNKFGGFPVVQAASLDQRPHCKGGPYSHGYNVDRGQYATVQVMDDPEGELCVKVDLKRLGNKLISFDTCHPELYPRSETQHCPGVIAVHLTPHDGNTVKIIIGCVILGALTALGFCLYKLKNRKKKIGNDQISKEKYDLASEDNDIEEYKKYGSGTSVKKEEDRLAHTEESYDVDFQGAI